MNQFNRVIKDNILLITLTLLLMFQNIFDNGSIVITIIIIVLQVVQIILELFCQFAEYAYYFRLLQFWTLILSLYFGSYPNVMSTFALCNLKDLLNQLIRKSKYKSMPILHYIMSDIMIFTMFCFQDLQSLHLSIVSMSINWIVKLKKIKTHKVKKNMDSYTQGELPDKNVIDSAGATNNHSRIKLQDKPSHNESPRHEKDNKLEILSIFPQGIGLFKVQDKNIDLEYFNDNMMKLSQAQYSDEILMKLYCLEKQQIADEQQKQQQEQKESLSSFSTFLQTPVPSNLIHMSSRNKKRSFTNKLQSTQKQQELYRQNSVFNNLEYKGVVLKKCDTLYEETILEQEMRLLALQMKKIEFQNNMKNQKQLIQEHVVVFGYQKGEDGKYRTIEVKLYNALINDAPYILILTRDITHRDYIKALQEYSKQKSKTLSFVSHEYRTPLNCIIEMLEQGIDEEQKHQSQTVIMDKEFRRSVKTNVPMKITKQIKIALDNAKYLLNLSDDLLDLAQIKVGKFKINKAKFNFQLLLESCVDLFQVSAEKKQIKLYINYDNKAPRFVFSDSSRLKQVMINLLGNAFKFTDEGSVTVKVSMINSKLDVSVIDTGIGIAEEDQAKIFQAFGKGNSEEHKKMNKSGVGLGLLISNQILQNLNQDIQNGLKFKSQHRKGSVFYFQISYQDNNEIQSLDSMEERNQDSEESISLQQQESIHKVYVHNTTSIFKRSTKAILAQQILIVDDVIMNIDMMKMKLDRLGIDSVDSAYNGFSAIDKCEKKWQANHDFYKLIFMDLEMPSIDGLNTTKKILEISQKFGVNVTIIGCSAYDSQQQKQECLDVGMKDYLTKPIQINDLKRIVQQYL